MVTVFLGVGSRRADPDPRSPSNAHNEMGDFWMAGRTDENEELLALRFAWPHGNTFGIFFGLYHFVSSAICEVLGHQGFEKVASLQLTRK